MMNKLRIRWAGHVAHMGQKKNVCRITVGKPKRKRPLDVDGRVILRWIAERYGGVVWAGLIWLRIGMGVGFLYTWE
jgi:hypothetical protein